MWEREEAERRREVLNWRKGGRKLRRIHNVIGAKNSKTKVPD